MSCQPRCPHSSRCAHPPVRSLKARDHARDVDGTTALDTGSDGTRPLRTGWTLARDGDHLRPWATSDPGNPKEDRAAAATLDARRPPAASVAGLPQRPAAPAALQPLQTGPPVLACSDTR